MDQRALWLSSGLAAAKLATALWCGLLAWSQLDRRRAILSWQIVLAALSVVVAGWAWTATSMPDWWKPTWLIGAMLAAALLLECVRRWVSASSDDSRDSVTSQPKTSHASRGAKGSPPDERLQGKLWAHWIIAWLCIGLGIGSTALVTCLRLPEDWLVRATACLQLVASAGLFGSAIACTLELTIGAVGPTLLQLNWRAVSRWTTLLFAAQLALSGFIIASFRAGESPVDSAATILYAFGVAVVSYIAWCMPRRMITLAKRGRVEGHASLAFAGWLVLMCMAIASVLPPAWPWNQLPKNSASAPALAIVEQ